MSRRRFLELVAATGAGAFVAPMLLESWPADAYTIRALPPGYTPSWPEGVMSGDPLPDGTVIWTRLGRPEGSDDLELLWEVATDATFTTIAAGGPVEATSAANWTVHIPVDGLDPDRWYHYRFVAGASTSPVGRLRTAPTADSAPDRLRFAYASCQQRGTHYVAHRAISEEPDLDFFMHLGDYVYVSDGGTVTLDDYRNVYAGFKADPLLQLVQQTVPLVSMFDDGEFYNGIDSTGPPERLANAHRAWFETMPVIAPLGAPTQAYRQFAWGSLADIFMIDVRSHRMPAITSDDTTTPEGAEMLADGRTTLGSAQRSWLLDGLGASTAAWRFLGNPYNMGLWRNVDLDPGPPRPPGVNMGDGVYAPNEAWDDYSWERRQILEFLRDEGIPNNISCSGHTHIWIASEMSPDPDDPSQPVVAFDFTTGSLTADPDPLSQFSDALAGMNTMINISRGSTTVNPWQTFVDFLRFGYTVVTVEPCATTIECKAINVYDIDAEPVLMARFRVHSRAASMESEFFTTPLYYVPDPKPTVPAFGEGTGLTPVAAECRAPEPTTTTTTTTPESTTSTSTSTTSGPTSSTSSPASTSSTGVPQTPAAQPTVATPDFTG